MAVVVRMGRRGRAEQGAVSGMRTAMCEPTAGQLLGQLLGQLPGCSRHRARTLKLKPGGMRGLRRSGDSGRCRGGALGGRGRGGGPHVLCRCLPKLKVLVLGL